jgi:hypothetical protein
MDQVNILDAKRSKADFLKVFGRFKYSDLNNGSILVLDRKWAKQIVKVAFGPKGVWAHVLLQPLLERCWLDWLALNHPYKIIRAEAFCPRHQYWNVKKPLSIHSWGAAVDVNPLTNMPGVIGDLPPEFIKIMETAGFTWGGRWKRLDYMHMEFT